MRAWVCKIWIYISCVCVKHIYLVVLSVLVCIQCWAWTNPPKLWTELNLFFPILLVGLFCYVYGFASKYIHISIEWGWLAQWGQAPKQMLWRDTCTSYIGPFSLLLANAKVFHNGRRFSSFLFSLLHLNTIRRIIFLTSLNPFHRRLSNFRESHLLHAFLYFVEFFGLQCHTIA